MKLFTKGNKVRKLKDGWNKLPPLSTFVDLLGGPLKIHLNTTTGFRSRDLLLAPLDRL